MPCSLSEVPSTRLRNRSAAIAGSSTPARRGTAEAGWRWPEPRAASPLHARALPAPETGRPAPRASGAGPLPLGSRRAGQHPRPGLRSCSVVSMLLAFDFGGLGRRRQRVRASVVCVQHGCEHIVLVMITRIKTVRLADAGGFRFRVDRVQSKPRSMNSLVATSSRRASRRTASSRAGRPPAPAGQARRHNNAFFAIQSPLSARRSWKSNINDTV